MDSGHFSGFSAVARRLMGPSLLVLAMVGPDIAAAAESDQLQEVVVTAEKRSENLQEVPIAVTAFTAESLKDHAITDVHTMGNLTPNVNLDQGSPFSGSNSVLSASIRGIGQDDFAFNLDPGVGVYVDGVYLGRTVGANQNLMDVDRVEILKGPQGTLFGRNTIGGAINIVTRTPGDHFTFEGEATTGSDDRRDFSASSDIPITDNLFSSITISSLERDGYQKRIPYNSPVPYVSDPPGAFHAADDSTQDTQGGQNAQTIRTKFLYKVSDDLKATLTADWTHTDQSSPANTPLEPIISGPQAAFGFFYNACLEGIMFAPTAPLVCGPRGTVGTSLWKANLNPATYRLLYNAADTNTGNIDTTYATGPNFDKMDSFGGSFTLDYSLADNLSLKSITGYRRLNWKTGMDEDGSPVDILETSFNEGQHQTSQEFQLNGRAFDDRLNFATGLYYFNEGGFIHDYVTFPGGLLQIDGPNELYTSSYAAYGHADYKLTDQIGLTLGARYSIEDKQFTGGQQELNQFFYKISGCYPYNAPSSIIGGPPNLTCQQLLDFPNPNNPNQVYPPGVNTQSFYIFNPTAGIQYHFDDDVMAYASYSKGFKSGGWTTRLTAPLPAPALAQSFGPEKDNSYELGLKSEWLDRHLIVNFAGFYSQYDNIQLTYEVSTSPVTQNAGNADIYGTELETHAILGDGFSINANAGYMDAYYTTLLPGAAALTGSKLPKTPKWKFNIGPEYDYTLPNEGVLRFLADWTHISSMFNDVANTPLLSRPTVDLLDASVTYTSPSDRYEVVAGGTNITNTRYITTGQPQYAGGIVYGTYNEPAEWYLTLRFKY
jgi:iron complex outermembrane receptor protein